MKSNNKENILELKREEQYETVESLLKKSKPSFSYWLFLVFASFIVACGILLENSAIVIGGMLVAPLLTPLLVLALAVSIGEINFIKRELAWFIFKSFLVVILASVIIAFFFGQPKSYFVFENTLKTALLYFVVALISGMAATFAWVRKEVFEVLPGTAIAVSLVPPLVLVGIHLAGLNFLQARFYFLLFLFNFFGILMGALIVFSLLQFYRVKRKFKITSED